MKYYVLSLISTLILLSGCATQSPTNQSDWVSGDSSSYKKTQYLLGRGDGSTQEEAKNKARAEIAKIIQVNISASSEDIQQFKSTDKNEAYKSQTSLHISTRSEQIVQGIQIAELWQDPATSRYHALAILPRLQTATRLRQQIAELDDATGNYIVKSRNSSDLFHKIAAANQAVQAQQERHSLQKTLQIVDLAGQGVEAKWNRTKLQSDLDSLLKRVSIAPQIARESTPGLATIVSGALANAGFMIETGQHPDFILHARMNLQDLGLRDGWYWQRGALVIKLTEAANGRVRGTKRWDIKESATDRENSVKRALDQADATLKQELRTAIIDMAIGQK